MENEEVQRCRNIFGKDPLMLSYHDNRWCKACHDDNELFAMLCLEGKQAGLSWSTIIRKEKAIRTAYDEFDIETVAKYGDEKIEELMSNTEIIKNKLKISAPIKNAKAILKLIESGEFDSFSDYVWHFTDGKTIIHHPKTPKEILAKNELSELVSKDMKKRGFSFVGPVIIYSFLQGIGVIDDHLENCPYKMK